MLESIPRLGEKDERPVLLHCVVDWNALPEHVHWIAKNNARVLHHPRVRIVALDASAGTFTMVEPDKPSRAVIPLDAIQGVWKDDADTDYQVAIRGLIVDERGKLRFLPA